METLIEHIKSHKPGSFKPKPFYSVEGDSLTFYFKDSESYGERVDDFLTVYLSMDDDSLVGCQVKGVPTAVKVLGDFGLIIQSGSIRLGMLFMAYWAASEEPDSKK